VSYDVGEVYSAVLSGVNGWIIPPGATDEFTSAVSHLLDEPDLLRRFRERARSTLVQRGFTLERMIEHYRDLLIGG
jgi:glycosyltransferase involved in cell wall biosynthesis